MPAAASDIHTVHVRYMSLTDVGENFRTMKTGLVELRSIFLRKAERSENCAVVTMQALELVHGPNRQVALLGLTVLPPLPASRLFPKKSAKWPPTQSCLGRGSPLK